ncbi:MAG: ZIP family metal transporter, partial [Chloroflexota bacterium]
SLMPPLPLGIVVAAFAGLSDLAGSATILMGQRRLERWFEYLLAYGAGFALAIALGELIPAGLEGGTQNAVWALAGFSTLHLTNRLLKGADPDSDAGDGKDQAVDGDCRSMETSASPGRRRRGGEARAAGSDGRPTGEVGRGERRGERGVVSGIGLTVIGVIICDFFDGVVVASAVGVAGGAAGQSAGLAEGGGGTAWLLLGGLFPHNFLEGASIALLILGAGLSRGPAWVLVVLLAAASLAGGFAVLLAVPEALRRAIQAFGGGLLLHLVASERIPELRGPHAKLQALLVVAGIATFVATEWLL